MILTTLFLLLLHFKTTESASTIARPGCQESCGGIPIPYPFGIGVNCSLSDQFNVPCDTTYNNGILTPYLGYFLIRNIILAQGQALVGSFLSSQCYNTTTKKEDVGSGGFVFSENSPFWFNTEKNKFTVIGCNTLAYLRLDLSNDSSVGCFSSCDSLETLTKYGSCSGIGCCQSAIPKETSDISVWFDERNNKSEVYNFSRCSYVMVVEEAAFKFRTTYITSDELSAVVVPHLANLPLYESQSLPVLVNWVIENTTCDIAQTNKSSYACISDHSICVTVNDRGYRCNCSNGYEGNPFLDAGCQGLSP